MSVAPVYITVAVKANSAEILLVLSNASARMAFTKTRPTKNVRKVSICEITVLLYNVQVCIHCVICSFHLVFYN